MKVSVVVILLLSLSPFAHADELTWENWNQWRGPRRDGSFQGPTWPDKLNGRLKKVWRVELGPSYASPVITSDRIFTVETHRQKQEVVRALDRKTGKQLWETVWDGSMSVPFFAAKNGSWVRSSPAFDGKHLYVGGMRDVLVCLDGETGKQVWRVDFVERFKAPLPAFGFVCSPLVTDDAVYVQAGGSVVKLDKKDGSTIWRSLKDGGGMYGSAFSSPVIVKLAGVEQLVVQTRSQLAGIELDNGRVLWEQPVKAFRGMNILTPTVYANGVFTSTYGGRTKLWKVTSGDPKLKVAQVWDNRLQGYMSSPVVIGDHAYLHLRNQRFACVALNSGEIVWSTQQRFGQYWSMIKQNERMLALDQDQTLRLIKATPEKFVLVDEVKVGEKSTWAHIAMSGHEIAVRELMALTLYDWK